MGCCHPTGEKLEMIYQETIWRVIKWNCFVSSQACFFSKCSLLEPSRHAGCSPSCMGRPHVGGSSWQARLSLAFQSSQPKDWPWLSSFKMIPAVQVTATHLSSKPKPSYDQSELSAYCAFSQFLTHRICEPIKRLLFSTLNLGTMCYVATDNWNMG